MAGKQRVLKVVLRRAKPGVILLCLLALLLGCHASQRDPNTVVFLIEMQSHQSRSADWDGWAIGAYRRADLRWTCGEAMRNFHFTPSAGPAAGSNPIRVTLVFHLRQGVRFHNGQPMTARDVVWTINSIRDGTVITAKVNYVRFNQYGGGAGSENGRLAPEASG